MTREEVLALLKKYAAISFECSEENITENTDIAEELGVKSFQRASMSALIEGEFEVMIPVARFGNFKTIGDLADYIMDEM